MISTFAAWQKNQTIEQSTYFGIAKCQLVFINNNLEDTGKLTAKERRKLAIISNTIGNANSKSDTSAGGHLYIWVLLAIFGGVLLGAFYPSVGVALKPLGDTFVKIVKLIIPPVIFLTIVTGIAGMGNMKALGNLALKAFGYFLFFSTLALFVGMFAANLIKPGVGMNIDPKTLDTSGVSAYIEKSHEMTIGGFFADLIPSSLVGAFVDGNVLQVLIVSIVFGIGFALAGEKARPALNILNSFSSGVFQVVNLLMKLAPIGAFGAMAFTIGKFGIGAIINLAVLVVTFYATSAVFIFGILGSVAAIAGFSLFKLLAYLKDELLLVLGTSSSESALPKLMEKMEIAGCDKAVVGIVVPTGYSFNLDGTNIYMALAAIFIAQATNTPLGFSDQLLLLLVAMISSKGAAGVTGAGFITLAATLSIVPSVPIAGLAIILGIDRFMSECRSITNFIGNAVATIVVAKWDKALDWELLKSALDGKANLSKSPEATILENAPAGLQIDEKDMD